MRFSRLQLLVLLLLLLVLAPARALAQDDPDEVPLGDVARNLRKTNPPAKTVIDDDNLSKVMEQAESHRELGSSLSFLMSGNTPGFHVAAPDVTCSLSFSANVKSLLSPQYNQMDLPAELVEKVRSKAVVEGDALTVPVFNGTSWHLSEMTVALTILRKEKSGETGMIPQPGVPGSTASSPPWTEGLDAFQQVRPERKPDTTVLYRMRAAAAPWSEAVFSAPLKMELAAGDEWHWAIVQVKGYPPEASQGKRTASTESTPPANQVSHPFPTNESGRSPEPQSSE